MLEDGKVRSLRELAEKEKVDNSYVSRMMNLTLLAPDIMAAILDDALPEGVSLFDLAVDLPAGWEEQRERLVTRQLLNVMDGRDAGRRIQWRFFPRPEASRQIMETEEAVRTPLEIRVACHAGYRGEEEPRRLWFDERVVHVAEILDRWISPDHRYFKVLGDDGYVYILRHDTRGEFWELTMFDRLSPSMHRQ